MIYTAEQVVKRYNELDSDREMWKTHWQELADYLQPNKDEITRHDADGAKKFQRILDNTGPQALELFAGMLHGYLTNSEELFFEFTSGDQKLDDDDDVREWLDDCARKTMNVLINSNFTTETHEMYLDLGSFGTSPLSVEPDDELVVRFGAYPIAQCVIDENHLGVVDTLMRKFEYTGKQILQKFPKAKLPDKVQKDIEKKPEKKHWIIHAIYDCKGEKDSAKKRMVKNKPFASHYVLVSEKFDLQLGGFDQFPYTVSRFSKRPGEKYGRSPGMTALPEVKMLNKMAETMIRGAQKVIDPPLQIPSDGFVLPINTRPGGLNFYMSGTGQRDEIKPIFNDTRIDFGFDMMNASRSRIRDAFYIDQLLMPSGGPQQTATEVNSRDEERLRFLGPLVARQHNEFLRPTINLVFNIMSQRGLYLEAPEKIAGKKLDVRYSSRIAKMQRLSTSNAIARAFNLAAPLIQIDPTAADAINCLDGVKEIWKLAGAPLGMLNKQKDIETIRDGRAKAQAQQLEVEKAQQSAQLEEQQSKANKNNATASQVA